MQDDRELLERMHAEIDGANAPDESARLRDELRSNPAAQATFEELRRLDDLLRGVGSARPPDDLAARIEREVYRAAPAWRGVREAGSARLVPARRVRLGYAWALAAGIVLGVALHLVLVDREGGGGRASDVAATMGGAAVPEIAATIARAEVDLPDGLGTARVSPAAGGAEVEVALGPGRDGEIALSWDPEVLALRAFSVPGGLSGPVAVAPGRIDWSAPGGRAGVARFAVVRVEDTTVGIATRAGGAPPAAVELPVGIAP